MTSNAALGEQNLDELIRSMQPVLHEQTYVFATVIAEFDSAALEPQMQFHEVEGCTLIIEQHRADSAGLTYEFPCKMITLNIHSSLDAVGFLARITTKLASLSMGVNPVSGFYHDHLFVPIDRAEDALDALRGMTI